MSDDFEKHLADMMKDDEFRAEYEALEPEYELRRQLIRARISSNMTQKQLAEKCNEFFSETPASFVCSHCE